MANMDTESGILSEKASEMTLVPGPMNSSSKELLLGVSDKEMGFPREKKSTSSIAMVPGSKELGSATPKSFTPTESSTLEENLRVSESPDGGDHKIAEPTSYPSGLRFGLLTAAVCLTIGTVSVLLQSFRDALLTIAGCS